LENVIENTWDGDNDTYFFVVTGDGYVRGVLNWSDPSHDLDWYLYCYYSDKKNPLQWYVMSANTVDYSVPEQCTSVVALTPGTPCYAWIVGWAAEDGVAYTLDLWQTQPYEE